MAKRTAAKRKKVRWLLNRHKNEYHRIVEGEDHDARCNIDKLSEEHGEFASTAKVFRDRGADAAKWCNVRFKSRENT